MKKKFFSKKWPFIFLLIIIFVFFIVRHDLPIVVSTLIHRDKFLISIDDKLIIDAARNFEKRSKKQHKSVSLEGCELIVLSKCLNNFKSSWFIPKVFKHDIDNLICLITEDDNYYLVDIFKGTGGIKYIVRKKDGKILKRNKTR